MGRLLRTWFSSHILIKWALGETNALLSLKKKKKSVSCCHVSNNVQLLIIGAVMVVLIP